MKHNLHNTPSPETGFRPWSDDLTAPAWTELREKLAQNAEFAAQFAHSQQQLVALHNALHNVNVPLHVLEQTLAKVTAECQALENPPTVASAIELNQAEHISRRNWLRWGSVAASLGLVTGGTYWYLTHRHATSPITLDELSSTMQSHVLKLQASATQWQAMNHANTVLETHPANALKIVPQRWTTLQSPFDSQTAVYDLLGSRKLAYLFVMQNQRPTQLPSAPYVKLSMSGNLAAGAWENSGCLYVLVIQQDLRFDSIVRTATVA